MKIKITLLGLAVMASLSLMASAQAVITSYCDVFPATESRLASISSIRKVEDTAVASAPSGSGSFATTVVFPDGTTSAIFTVAQHVRSSKINGIVTTASPGVVDIAQSKFNPEGDTALPSLFYRDSSGTLVVPVNSNFVGTTLINPKTVFITENRATLPQLVAVGDYWQTTRDLTGTYVLNGNVIPFSVTGQVAQVIVVNETTAPVAVVTTEYPNDPKITSTAKSDTNVTLTATGLTVDSYYQTWWMESSIDLANWAIDNSAIVGPNVTITFPVIPGESERFYRVKGLQP